jgi:hypothetical protein
MEFTHYMVALLSLAFVSLVSFASALGQNATIAFENAPGSLQLAGSSISCQIWLDEGDWAGVIRTGYDLAQDFGRVTGLKAFIGLVTPSTNSTRRQVKNSQIQQGTIIAGTIGKSRLIDYLIETGTIDVSAVIGKWESFSTQIVATPRKCAWRVDETRHRSRRYL